MIELLILYKLSKKVLTMYGISKDIHNDFAVLTTPSYGTIKPALNRLQKMGCVLTQKVMSTGGRPSTYYSITKEGLETLEKELLSPIQENPVHFLTTARIRLICSEVLGRDEQSQLYKMLKLKSETLMVEIKGLLEENGYMYIQKVVLDNLLCEYNNFCSLLEGLTRASKN